MWTPNKNEICCSYKEKTTRHQQQIIHGILRFTLGLTEYAALSNMHGEKRSMKLTLEQDIFVIIIINKWGDLALYCV